MHILSHLVKAFTSLPNIYESWYYNMTPPPLLVIMVSRVTGHPVVPV